jgi:hypothetical protein
MEKVNKLWTACREGHKDPRDYFLSLEEVTERIAAKLQFVNAEKVEGTIYKGIPNEVWLREGGDQRMEKLTAEQTYVFHPDLRVLTVSKGHVRTMISSPEGDRQAWWFRHEDLWRFEGRRVALHFDKTCPENCPILVHAQGREANEVIGQAELVDGCPQFALGFDAESEDTRGADALANRKQFSDAFRSEYRALGINHVIARSKKASNGKGKSVELTSPAPLTLPFGERKNAAIDLVGKAINRKENGMPASFQVRGATARKSLEEEEAEQDALLAEIEIQEAQLRKDGLLSSVKIY